MWAPVSDSIRLQCLPYYRSSVRLRLVHSAIEGIDFVGMSDLAIASRAFSNLADSAFQLVSRFLRASIEDMPGFLLVAAHLLHQRLQVSLSNELAFLELVRDVVLREGSLQVNGGRKLRPVPDWPLHLAVKLNIGEGSDPRRSQWQQFLLSRSLSIDRR